MVALLVILVVFALYAYVWVRTFLDIRRSPLSADSKFTWMLLVLFAQVLGPMAWWWFGPGARHRQSA